MADVQPDNEVHPVASNNINDANSERESMSGNNQQNNINEPIAGEAPGTSGNSPENNPNQQNATGTNNNAGIRIEQQRRFHLPRAHLANMSERIIYSLFVKFAFSYGQRTSAAFRRIFEFYLLAMALILLFLLVYMHTAFSNSPAKCLEHIKDSWPKDGILRVEVIKNHDPNYSLEHSYLKEELMQQKHMEYLGGFGSDFDIFFGSSEHATYAHYVKNTVPVHAGNSSGNESDHIIEDSSLNGTKDIIDEYETMIEEESIAESSTLGGTNPDEEESIAESSTLGGTNPDDNSTLTVTNPEDSPIVTRTDPEEIPTVKQTTVDDKETLEKITLAAMSEEYIVEYSLEYGFLRLSPATRKKLNISVQLVVLDPVSNECFGDFISKLIFDEILGYDDVLMLSVKHLAESEENKGFLRNVVTGEHYKFVNMWMGNSNYLAAAIVMMIFTLSVSMLLRYSHHQIFMFIVDLLQMLELNGSMTFPAAQMLTVILALVGMEAIMSEYFKDTSTAFYIIVLVWFCDQYDAICCHTAITRRHWLRFFYLYHFAFYSYHYRFNGQYSWLALVTSATFIAHSMLYFFHHYELPAMMQHIRMGHHGQIRTLNIVLHNVPPAGGHNEAVPNNNAAWPGGPPGVAIRNPEQIRDGTRLVNLVMQNMATPAVAQNQNGRRLFLQVLFQNLRNALRNVQNGRDNNAPETEQRQEVQQGDTPQPLQPETGNADGYGVENMSYIDISVSSSSPQPAASADAGEEHILAPLNASSDSSVSTGTSDEGESNVSIHSNSSQLNMPATNTESSNTDIRRRLRLDDQLNEEGSRESLV